MADCESGNTEYLSSANAAPESLPQMIHELRTPLTSIRGSLGLLQTGAFGQLTEQGQRMLQIALQNTERLMRLTNAIGQESTVPTNIMSAQAMARLRLETDLRSALSRQEFQVYYQPVKMLSTNQLLGFEALVRWQHPSLGMVSPVQFIPLAEETELILPIGAWVLQESCHQLREWQQQFPMACTLTMSVNLSSRQLANSNFVDHIDQVLSETKLDPHCLKLEITESGMMEQAEVTANSLFQLRQRGIQIYIDDFGTGYSSLSRLHELPIDVLKIDRSFVSQMCSESAKLQIVHSIITLASSLKMEIIAEGIETSQQVHLLSEMGCNMGQGALFAMPMDRSQATALLKR